MSDAETFSFAARSHIEYVIGMDNAISDESAIAFSVGLYQAVGAGKTVAEAYKLGCVQVGLQIAKAGDALIQIFKVKGRGVS